MAMQKDSEIRFSLSHHEAHLPGREALTISQACDLLQRANVRNCSQLPNGTNYVFLATLLKDEMKINAIYKPRRGEIPLWDFPEGTLYKREYAAFIVSQTLEWNLVPPTVIRDGPYGVGSMQWFVDTISGVRDYSQVKDTSILKRVALFDYVINNADRKASHFLGGKDGRLWLVDHGLTFNAAPKLRTVLWDFSGEAVPDRLLVDVRALQSKLRQKKRLRDALRRLLKESEIEALESRINSIIEKPAFVYPGPHRSVPWPWF
jgi:hypothetical protein